MNMFFNVQGTSIEWRQECQTTATGNEGWCAVGLASAAGDITTARVYFAKPGGNDENDYVIQTGHETFTAAPGGNDLTSAEGTINDDGVIVFQMTRPMDIGQTEGDLVLEADIKVFASWSDNGDETNGHGAGEWYQATITYSENAIDASEVTEGGGGGSSDDANEGLFQDPVLVGAIAGGACILIVLGVVFMNMASSSNTNSRMATGTSDPGPVVATPPPAGGAKRKSSVASGGGPKSSRGSKTSRGSGGGRRGSGSRARPRSGSKTSKGSKTSRGSKSGRSRGSSGTRVPRRASRARSGSGSRLV